MFLQPDCRLISQELHAFLWRKAALGACLLALTILTFPSKSHGKLQTAPSDSITSVDSSVEPDLGSKKFLPEELWSNGWIALWDGETTYGWRNTKSTSIAEGIWELSKEESVVRTAAEFTNYQLKIEYSLNTDGDANLLLRTNPTAIKADVDHYPLKLPQTGDNVFRTFVCTVFDESGTIDNRKTIDIFSPNRGYIGFRINAGKLRIKRILLQPTIVMSPPKTITREGVWLNPEPNAGSFKSQDNELRLVGGPFYLSFSLSALINNYAADHAGELAESINAMPADFLLQFDCKSSESTNSGLFFRCIPGEKLNGYEAQINNQFKDGDRTEPADCGTGGIFRRCDARRIVADSDQWFKETIVVNGAQISVWVNGYQVTDWSDQRAPHPNPRKGKRLESGELQLQSHDEETDVTFRNMQMAPYFKRTLGSSKLPNR